jgi:hypothetical protein
MNDDDYGNLLLRPLDTGAPAGPGRIDVARAMRNGRRSRRVRAWSAGSALTAGLAAAVTGGVLALQPPAAEWAPALPVDPALPSSCTASALPMGAAKSAGVEAGDPSGTYLVGASEPVYGGDNDVLVWKDGKLVAAVAQRNPQVGMLDINVSGVAVGSTLAGRLKPYAFHDGEVSRMKGTGSAIAINDAGVIAGDTETAEAAVPQRWSSWDAEPVMMPLPAGMTTGQAFDLTEDGTILTSLSDGTHDGTYLWHADDTVERIEPPEVAPNVRAGIRPVAIHFGWIYAEVTGQVAGSSGPGAQSTLYRYEPESRTWQRLSPDPWSVQVPAVQRRGGGFIADKPRTYVGDRVLELPTLTRYEDDAFQVRAISSNGRLAAGSNLSGVAADRPVVPLIWRCR